MAIPVRMRSRDNYSDATGLPITTNPERCDEVSCLILAACEEGEYCKVKNGQVEV